MKVVDRVASYLSRLKFVFNAVLETFSFDFHRCKYQAIADEVRCVTDTFASLEAETFYV